MNSIRSTIRSAMVLFSMILAGWSPAASAGTDSTGISAAKEGTRYFAGINLLSPVPAMLPVPGNTLFSVLSNLECGIGMNGGLFIRENEVVELRLAYGPNSRSERIFNVQAYYGRYFWQKAKCRFKGAYAGGGVRFWDLFNRLTDVHRNNIAEEIAIGYRFHKKGPLYFDMRINEIIGIYSWLSAEHTRGGWASVFSPSLPKMPLVTIDAGWTF